MHTATHWQLAALTRETPLLAACTGLQMWLNPNPQWVGVEIGVGQASPVL